MISVDGTLYVVCGYYDDTNTSVRVPVPCVTCTFSGTSIAWVGAMNDNHGDASASVDGGPAATADMYPPQWNRQVLYQSGQLRPGGTR